MKIEKIKIIQIWKIQNFYISANNKLILDSIYKNKNLNFKGDDQKIEERLQGESKSSPYL